MCAAPGFGIGACRCEFARDPVQQQLCGLNSRNLDSDLYGRVMRSGAAQRNFSAQVPPWALPEKEMPVANVLH